MPLPFFWICMGITTVTIGAIVAYEAHMRYIHFREQQEYRQYAQQYAENHRQPPPSDEQEFKDDSSDDEDKNKEDNVMQFVRDINDNSELRRRIPRSKSPALTTNDESGTHNRPVSDKSWVDETEYELNEMEQKLSLKKQYIEREQELLNKAEMDLERRWQLHQNRSSDLLEHMSTSYASDNQQREASNAPSTSSSYLSMNTSTRKSAHYELSNESNSLQSTQLRASSSGDHVTPSCSTLTNSGIHTNSSMDESIGRLTPTKSDCTSQEQSFASVLPSSSQPSIINDNNTTSGGSSNQQHTSDSSIGLSAENPWSFEDDDLDDGDDNDGTLLSMSFESSMRFPSSSDNNNNSTQSQQDSIGWDEHSSTNDMLSLSSHGTSSSMAGHEINSLITPSGPSSSSSDGGSYDLVRDSDIENGS